MKEKQFNCHNDCCNECSELHALSCGDVTHTKNEYDGQHEHVHDERCRNHDHAHDEHGCKHAPRDGMHDGCSCGSLSAHLSEEKEKFRLFTVENVLFAAGLLVYLLSIIFKSDNFYVELVKYIVAYALIGYPVLWSCAKNIVRGKIFDENLLMTLAGVGAFILGEYIEAVAIVIFFSIGERFQDFAVSKSAEKIQKALDIIPQNATLINGETRMEIPTKSLKIGDIIEVKTGARVPVDCTLLTEHALFDTSVVTGETTPREAKTADEVLSGFICSENLVRLSVIRTSENSAASKIIDMVKEATENKSKSENFITRFAKFYTPIVFALAVLIAVLFPLVLHKPFSSSFQTALTFLLVSCPCALVVSIPLCFFSGLGRCAKAGALVKGSNYLNTLANVDTVLFDKTGTLTSTEFTVDATVSAGTLSESEIFDYISSVEIYSNHPLAKAISAGKTQKFTAATDIKEIAGSGITAKIDGKEVFVGKCEELKSQNKTAVGLKIDGVFQGYVTLSAKILDGTKQALAILQKCGIKNFAMITGDNKNVSLETAGELGIDTVYSEMTPADKLETVADVTNRHRGKTAYVGDGINDVPSLARADVGISASSVQDAAINAADIVLTKNGIAPLASAKATAVRTKKKVIWNVTFALLIKIVILTISVFIPLPLFVAVLADVGCCLITILFSVLL